MALEFKAAFDYDGKEPGFFEKPFVEKLFVLSYNYWCDQANPHLETWNDEYTGPNDGGNPGSKYDAYIRDKASFIVDEINEIFAEGSKGKTSIEKFFLDEHCRFLAKLKNGSIMGVHLENM